MMNCFRDITCQSAVPLWYSLTRRCIQELGFVQAPMVVDDATQVDRQALERQRLLVMRKDHHLHHHHHHHYHHLHIAKREFRETRFRAIRASPMTPSQPISAGPVISAKVSDASPTTGSSASTVTRCDELQTTSHQPSTITGVLRKSNMGRRKKSTRRQYGSATSAARLVSLQPRPVGSIIDSSHGRMPAPNVNAVHLLQVTPYYSWWLSVSYIALLDYMPLQAISAAHFQLLEALMHWQVVFLTRKSNSSPYTELHSSF